MPTPEALAVVDERFGPFDESRTCGETDDSVENRRRFWEKRRQSWAAELDRFAAQRGADAAPEPRCRMEQFGDGSCDCPQCLRMRGAAPQTGGGDAGERARAIADLFGMTEADRHPDDMAKAADIIRSSHREGAEAMREAALAWHETQRAAIADALRETSPVDGQERGRLLEARAGHNAAAAALRTLPIPGKTDAG